MLIFAAVLLAVFHRAIFFGEILAPLDLLSKELPWRAVLPPDAPIANFTEADVLTIFYPWWHFIHDELRAGRFPLWCSHVGCGYPLCGQGMLNVFGLTSLCLWIAPPRVALTLLFTTQLFVGMTGMYALLRAVRLRWATAVFAALAFGLNSRMFQDLALNCTIGALVMFPWICWALWRGVLSERGFRYYALAGLFYGWGILNGSLQTHVILWLSATGFVVMAAWRQRRDEFLAVCLNAVGTFSLLGMAIGAVALLPNLELFVHNERQRFHHIDWQALMLHKPLALFPWGASLVNPDIIGNSRTFDLVRGLGHIGTAATTPSMAEVRQYCGLAALVMAVFGLRSRSDAKLLGVVLVMVPAVVGFLTPLYLFVYFRVLATIPCGITMLAALGLERFWQRDEALARDVRAAVVTLVAAVVLMLGIGGAVSAHRKMLTEKVEQIGLKGTSFHKTDLAWQRQRAEGTVNNFTAGGTAVVRFGMLAGVVVGLLVLARKHPAAVIGLVVVNTVDLVEFAWRTEPSVPRHFEYPPTPALEFLQRQPGRFRVVSFWDSATEWPTARENTLMVYGLDDPRVYDALIPKNPLLDAKDWEALNVRYCVTPPGAASPGTDWQRVFRGEVDVYENPQARPRFYFTDDLQVPTPKEATLSVEKYDSGSILLKIHAPRAGWLVAGERNYPGWRGFVNERETAVLEVAGLWQAVHVEPGTNVVRLLYRPLTVYGGAMISLAALLMTTALILWPVRTQSVAVAGRTGPRCP